MKTTLEIPDPLFREAKEYAARNNIPLREVFVRGLRTVVQDAPARSGRFKLKSITTKGEGLVSGEDWSAIRSLIYEGRGG